MPPHPLNHFLVQGYQNEPKFDGVFSRNNLPFVKMQAAQTENGTHILNFDEYKSVATH